MLRLVQDHRMLRVRQATGGTGAQGGASQSTDTGSGTGASSASTSQAFSPSATASSSGTYSVLFIELWTLTVDQALRGLRPLHRPVASPRLPRHRRRPRRQPRLLRLHRRRPPRQHLWKRQQRPLPRQAIPPPPPPPRPLLLPPHLLLQALHLPLTPQHRLLPPAPPHRPAPPRQIPMWRPHQQQQMNRLRGATRHTLIPRRVRTVL
ncbi:uncharacterized protein BT62DRAFT_211689 [Guyanagaster necrorhizus]|uniref:Uncharacterized protein n=1 Tax=Guyanagaster necrorhizus TaxID=856835 RepID=A0A9P8ARP8_9AGAR|nr:uncharacterized protein BT62DRAFT_211689 [Guyanagaster necrorhizus MCA 3950]KAG7445131.1 hypothetical protein BT62DRAFT_211689 [Guyanagaster necrorhizus MCA 3950]